MTDKSIFKKSFFGAALGTMIEYYDYGLYMVFLPVISPIFFPAQSAYQSLFYGYIILFLSLLVRPLGGLLFGHLGDVIGRKRALLLSMYGIALATFAIGLAPSYAAIGCWAIVLIASAKAIQGFCFAGEYNGAGIYVVEHAQQQREALTGSLLTATMLMGSLLSALVGVVVTAANMPVWSWRLAFMFGGCLGLFGIFYRKNMHESPGFKAGSAESRPLSDLFKLYPRELFAGICIGALGTVPYTTIITFINPVLMAKGYFTAQQLMLLQAFTAVFAVLTLVGVGFIADKFSPGKTMRLGCCLLALLSFPLLFIVDNYPTWCMVLALTGIIIMNEIFLGPANAYLKNLYPINYRYRGSSFSFSCGMSILGGLTPLVEHYLYQTTGQFSSTAIWIAFISLSALLSMHMVENLPQRSALYAPEIR